MEEENTGKEEHKNAYGVVETKPNTGSKEVTDPVLIDVQKV